MISILHIKSKISGLHKVINRFNGRKQDGSHIHRLLYHAQEFVYAFSGRKICLNSLCNIHQ